MRAFLVLLAFQLVLLRLLVHTTDAITSMANGDFHNVTTYEFELVEEETQPGVYKNVEVMLEFENRRQCFMDFGQGCICYETIFQPMAFPLCSRMGAVCLFWNRVGGHDVCPFFRRNSFVPSYQTGRGPAFTNAVLKNVPISICSSSDTQHFLYHRTQSLIINPNDGMVGATPDDPKFILPEGWRDLNEPRKFRFGFVHSARSCRFSVSARNANLLRLPPSPVPTPPSSSPSAEGSGDAIGQGRVDHVDPEPENVSTTTASPEGDTHVAGADSSALVAVLLLVFLLIIIETAAYVVSVRVAAMRRGCFASLDKTSSNSRMSAGKDAPKAGKASCESVEQKTNARDFDNFGNLTTEERTDTVSQDRPAEKRTKSSDDAAPRAVVPHGVLPSERNVDPSDPMPGSDKVKFSDDRLDKTQSLRDEVKPASSMLVTCEAEPPTPSVNVRRSRESAPKVPLKTEKTIWRLVREGKLRKERPQFFKVFLIMTACYVASVLLTITIGVLIEVLY